MSAVTPTTVIEDALRLLHPADEVFEVRILGSDRAGTVISGYFNDRAIAAAEIAKWDGKAEGIYHTINPVAPALLERADNRLRVGVKSGQATSDADILRRTMLPIDVDPDRPAKTSATGAELKAAGRVIRLVKTHLEDELGWPAGILVMSGNGGHLNYPIDLPNDVESRDLLKRVLAELAKKYDEQGVAHVDKSVWNASRIMKVSGTMACKGDSTPERPHRRSKLLEVPEGFDCVPRSALEALAGPAAVKKPTGTTYANGSGSFDVEQFMAHNGLVVRNVKEEDGATTWVLEICPANAEHDRGEAFVRRAADGKLSAGCQHNSCSWQWADLRERFEPGYVRGAARSYPDDRAEIVDPVTGEVGAAAVACTVSHEVPKPAPLGAAAYHGPLGAFVEAWAPHTEADPAALLATLLVGYSSILGPGPRHTVSGDVHAARLWACVVGASSAARKGMSYKPARNLLAGVDPAWDHLCTASGLSTGEGLIHRVRDRVLGSATDKKTGEVSEVVEDAGVEDKRLFLLESEFARVLTVMARRDNTLSAILRGLWDSGEAGVMTRSAPATTHGAHVCLITHITIEELRRALADCDAANGFANRFLWVYAERHGSLPFGGQADSKTLEQIRGQLARAFINAPDGEIGWSDEARDLWAERYDGLLRGGGGLTGSIIARGQPQVLRLALIYALADNAVVIERVHLEAALEVWRYCADSARYLFGERTGDSTADRILGELRERGSMTRNDIRELFDRHKSSTVISAALETLRAAGLAESEKAASEGGRPAEVWTAC